MGVNVHMLAGDFLSLKENLALFRLFQQVQAAQEGALAAAGGADADGYCGDEDNGQTSAWYVFSAMGFYPVCPATDQYILGSPYFKEMNVKLENGKTLTIAAPDNSSDTPYVAAMSVNGKKHDRNYLTHKQLTDGGRIDYRMSATPDTSRGTKEAAFPYSFSTAK